MPVAYAGFSPRVFVGVSADPCSGDFHQADSELVGELGVFQAPSGLHLRLPTPYDECLPFHFGIQRRFDHHFST